MNMSGMEEEIEHQSIECSSDDVAEDAEEGGGGECEHLLMGQEQHEAAADKEMDWEWRLAKTEEELNEALGMTVNQLRTNWRRQGMLGRR